MFYFLIGLLVGILVTCIGVRRLIVGKLKYIFDEDGAYFFMELSDSSVSKIVRRKYVVLKVDKNTNSQK